MGWQAGTFSALCGSGICCYSNPNVSEALLGIFQDSYRELRPRAPIPELQVEFFAFASINNTIRLREGKLFARLSDLLEGAPQPVLRAIAHILLAKMYRKPVEKEHATRYRRYISTHDITQKAHLVRQLRGRKRIGSAQGHVYDLEEIFEELNARHFYGLLARPQMTWSRGHARNSLGHYDPAHNAIVVSRIFDHPRVPRYAVEYLVYHEMLHLKHPVKLRGGRRCVHSSDFQAEERLFPRLDEAKAFLKRL
jgi:predicted metal-dependent hydrolase